MFGAGNPHADLMFVGEAPGFHEDKQGVPFVGQAGKLLDKLLAGIGLAREDVYIANVLKCRPPGNRDPQQDEIESCEPHLFRQIELIEPKVIATLGNFATKLLSGRPLGITRVHGQEQELTIAGRSVLLYPLYHPAAALYTPAMLKVLEADFARLPGAPRCGRACAARSASPSPSRSPRSRLPPSSSACSRRRLVEPLHGDHAEVRGALAQALRLLVLGRVVPALRGLEVGELEDDEPGRIPVSLEHRELAAAHDEAAAARVDGVRRRSLVALVLLGVVDVGLDDHVGGHGWIVRVEQQSHSPEETEALAAELAQRLATGDVVTVAGELGSGKTTFVRGACGALGVRERVTSPTYTIGHRYHGDGVEVSHLDLYRFEGVSAAEWGDLEPYFDGAIAFVEWPEAGEGVLPAPRFAVRLRHAGAGRAVEIEEC